MPTYRVTAPDGRKLTIRGEVPPTEQALQEIFAQLPPQQSQAQAPAVAPEQPPQGPSVSDAAIGAAMPFFPPQVSRGIAQGVGKTAVGIADLTATGLRQIPGVRNFVPDESTFDAARARLEPQNTQQQIGQGLEQTAEFFAPGVALGKLKTAAKTGVGLLDALIGAGLEGASATAVSSAQHGNAGAEELVTGGASAGTGLVAQGLGKALGPLGRRVEESLVKAHTRDYQDGFNVANIYKHKLGGTLSQTYDKASAAIQKYGEELKSYLNISNQLGRKVNLLDELNGVAADLEGKASKTFGQNADIRRALEKLREDPLFQKIGPDGTIDLSTANEVKQAVGGLGAWLTGPKGQVMGADDRAMETVANALYDRLKKAIEQQAIGPIRVINQKLSEVIPIRQAIIRRIPVEQRGNVLNMGDLLALSSHDLGLSLANRVLRSGRTANAMVNTAERTTGAGVTRATAAGVSQASQR